MRVGVRGRKCRGCNEGGVREEEAVEGVMRVE